MGFGNRQQGLDGWDGSEEIHHGRVAKGARRAHRHAQDGAQVRVAPCGSYLCAILVKTKSPVDPETGQPWTDRHSHDPAQRDRPLIGTAVLNTLVADGPGKWSGRLSNVDNGESYEGHLLELNTSTIRVEGCALGTCGGQNMTRLQ